MWKMITAGWLQNSTEYDNRQVQAYMYSAGGYRGWRCLPQGQARRLGVVQVWSPPKSMEQSRPQPVHVHVDSSTVHSKKCYVTITIIIAIVIKNAASVMCSPKWMYCNSTWSTTMHMEYEYMELAILKAIDTETHDKTIRYILATCIVTC